MALIVLGVLLATGAYAGLGYLAWRLASRWLRRKGVVRALVGLLVGEQRFICPKCKSALRLGRKVSSDWIDRAGYRSAN